MIAYVDASVLLRVALRPPGMLSEWRQIEPGSLERTGASREPASFGPPAPASPSRGSGGGHAPRTILRLIASLEIVEIDSAVLDRAAQPMPTEIGTLDAIHLATALLWRDMMGADLVMATHDQALATAARAYGMAVVGIPQP